MTRQLTNGVGGAQVAELQASLAKLQDIAQVNSGLMRRIGAEFSIMSEHRHGFIPAIRRPTWSFPARKGVVHLF